MTTGDRPQSIFDGGKRSFGEPSHKHLNEMNSLIFFTLICACAAFPQTFISDTPEVHAEKQRFFQLYNAAAKAAAAAPDVNTHSQQPHHYSQHSAHRFAPTNTQAYHQPQQTYNPVPNHIQSHHQNPQYTPKWTGPVAATIPAGLPGSAPQVANTPEVEAAIADFSRRYNAAVVATRSSSPSHNQYQGAYNPAPTNQYNQGFNQAHQPQYRAAAPAPQPRWTGPLAATIPAGLPGSAPQVADTPEVQAAKAQFGRVFQQQLTHVLG